MYRRPGLLILDEPTSQMDPRGEHQIVEQIKDIAADRITIVVTHRLENTQSPRVRPVAVAGYSG